MAEEAEFIGGRMKELREAKGMTQREFASALPGKTEGKDVSRWENGRHRPGPDTLGKIAEVLGTTVADLHAGPVGQRKPQAPTPDPFAATEPDADVSAQLRELLAGQLILKTKLEKVERLLKDQQSQTEAPVRKRKAGSK